MKGSQPSPWERGLAIHLYHQLEPLPSLNVHCAQILSEVRTDRAPSTSAQAFPPRAASARRRRAPAERMSCGPRARGRRDRGGRCRSPCPGPSFRVQEPGRGALSLEFPSGALLCRRRWSRPASQRGGSSHPLCPALLRPEASGQSSSSAPPRAPDLGKARGAGGRGFT